MACTERSKCHRKEQMPSSMGMRRCGRPRAISRAPAAQLQNEQTHVPTRVLLHHPCFTSALNPPKIRPQSTACLHRAGHGVAPQPAALPHRRQLLSRQSQLLQRPASGGGTVLGGGTVSGSGRQGGRAGRQQRREGCTTQHGTALPLLHHPQQTGVPAMGSRQEGGSRWRLARAAQRLPAMFPGCPKVYSNGDSMEIPSPICRPPARPPALTAPWPAGAARWRPAAR